MKLIGEIDGKGLYVSYEGEGNLIKYNLDGEEIALYDLKIMRLEDPIVFRENTVENELSAQAKDMIQTLARDVDVEELKVQEKDLDDYRSTLARTLGIKEKDMVSYTEIDLNEKVEDIDESEEKADNKEKLATTRDVNIKQELDENAMATSTRSIGKVLKDAGKMPNIPGKNFTKFGVIESTDTKNINKDAKVNTTRYSFVAIATDGTVAPVNLVQDYQEGNNPREIGYRTKADGGAEQDDVNSRYQIGNSEETISIKTPNGPGEIEIGYSAHKTLGGEGIEGNQSVDHQLETSSVYWRPRKSGMDQEYADGIKGTEDKVREAHTEESHNEKYKEGNKGKIGDNDEHKNIDGKEETKKSDHEAQLKAIAKEIYDKQDTFTEKEIYERVKAEHDKGTNMEKVEEDIIEDAEMLKTHNR